MTGKTFEAARDCMSKIADLTPTEEQVREMFSFLAVIDRLAEIGKWEGPSGLSVEAPGLPGNTPYEKAFKESIFMWMDGASVEEACDHAADRYFENDPAGYDAAIFFAGVFSVGNILRGEMSYCFIDQALQYLLPDGWRWREEDHKAAEAHKNDKDWSPLLNAHRDIFLGDSKEEIRHRFDDIKICDLILTKDQASVAIAKRIADKLPGYRDGALQLILKKLTVTEFENALYVLPEEAGDRILSNLDPFYTSTIKGDCILRKDSVDPIDIRLAVSRLEEAMDAYDGDPSLEAEYEN